MNFTEKQNVIFWTEIWTWRTQVMGEALFHIRLYHSTCNLVSPVLGWKLLLLHWSKKDNVLCWVISWLSMEVFGNELNLLTTSRKLLTDCPTLLAELLLTKGRSSVSLHLPLQFSVCCMWILWLIKGTGSIKKTVWLIADELYTWIR